MPQTEPTLSPLETCWEWMKREMPSLCVDSSGTPIVAQKAYEAGQKSAREKLLSEMQTSASLRAENEGLRGQVERLTNALLAATDREENPEIAFQNMMQAGRDRHAECKRIDEWVAKAALGAEKGFRLTAQDKDGFSKEDIEDIRRAEKGE